MCVGTPAFVISQVAHQEDKANSAENVGAAINLGQSKSWDKNRLSEIFKFEKESLQAMSAAGKKCIDGKGLKRVVEAILSIC
jgi:spore coat polysaccharide biosynthesis predicted glycosyltransferase SpsG